MIRTLNSVRRVASNLSPWEALGVGVLVLVAGLAAGDTVVRVLRVNHRVVTGTVTSTVDYSQVRFSDGRTIKVRDWENSNFEKVELGEEYRVTVFESGWGTVTKPFSDWRATVRPIED